MNSHPHSDQTLVVLQGMLSAEIADKKILMHRGDSVTVPAGTPHRFVNICGETVTTFHVYSPPAYSIPPLGGFQFSSKPGAVHAIS